jgi:chemotaxis protein CheD
MSAAASPRAKPERPAGDARQYYDPKTERWMVKVQPGAHFVGRSDDQILVTVLGSCVAACIWDEDARIGGMNHFMLPEQKAEDDIWTGAGDSLRYGNHAMETLINDLFKAGAERARLQVKLFGGGNVLKTSRRIGDLNSEFALSYIKREGLRLAAHDLGGDKGRRVHFSPTDGKARRLLIDVDKDVTLARDETQYRKTIVAPRPATSIELF